MSFFLLVSLLVVGPLSRNFEVEFSVRIIQTISNPPAGKEVSKWVKINLHNMLSSIILILIAQKYPCTHVFTSHADLLPTLSPFVLFNFPVNIPDTRYPFLA